MKNLKEILLETDSDFLVPGIGTYDYETLKSNIIRKFEDLVRRAKDDKFRTIGDDQFEVLTLYWKTISDHVPEETPFKSY